MPEEPEDDALCAALETTYGSFVVPTYLTDLFLYGHTPPTPEELAERERWREKAARRKAEAWPRLDAAIAQFDVVTEPALRAVLDLHTRDDRGECAGCDFGGYEAEAPAWPCRTITAIAPHLNVDVDGLDVLWLQDREPSVPAAFGQFEITDNAGDATSVDLEREPGIPCRECGQPMTNILHLTVNKDDPIINYYCASCAPAFMQPEADS